MIENELKYVLRLGDWSNEIRPVHYGSFSNITQGYFDKFRIRSENGEMLDQYVLNFKRRREDGRNIEIETEISKDFFDQTIDESSSITRKKRFAFNKQIWMPDYNDEWVIDFFVTSASVVSDIYFVMAEVEMPEDKNAPSFLPTLIKEKMVYSVPRDDNRFTSKALADVGYATALYNSLVGNS